MKTSTLFLGKRRSDKTNLQILNPNTKISQPDFEFHVLKKVNQGHLYGVIILLLLLGISNFTFGQTITQNIPGNYQFTVPAGVTSITIQAWGAGGAGGSGNSGSGERGGGGGGAFATRTISVSPGAVFNYTVGAGGIPSSTSNTNPSSAGVSYFGNTNQGSPAGNQVLASAGAYGTSSAGGTGGTAASCIPTAGAYSGGNGSADDGSAIGGGGGGSAGGGSIGGNGGTPPAAGIAGTAGSLTAGAQGGLGGVTGAAGTSGSAPGGGGGGKGNGGSLSGSGASGQIIITYCGTAAPIVNPLVTYCQNATASTLSATGSNLLWYSVATGGTGSATAPTPVTTVPGTTSHWVSQTSGCESSRSRIDVFVNSKPVTSVTNKTDITCFGANDGTITVSVTGGTFPYQFSVDEGANFQGPTTGNTISHFTGLTPGTIYKIVVYDKYNCYSR